MIDMSWLTEPSIPVAKEEIGGLTISTVNTPDEGHETALIDRNGVHPVERYASLKEAKQGHAKWVKFAKNKKNKSITMLGGFGGLVANETIQLKRA